MKEIYYPDGSVGIVSPERIEEVKQNPPLDVINPPAAEGKFPRAISKHKLVATIDGNPLMINVGLFGVKEKDVNAEYERIKRDAQGKEVFGKDYVLATNQILDKGMTGRKNMNEDGVEVAPADIRYFIKTADGEKEVVKFTKTEEIQIKEMPSGTEDAYILKAGFEVVPDSDEDRRKLWRLTEHLKKNEKVGIDLAVFREGWDKFGVIFIPYIDKKNNKFALLAKPTSRKFTLENSQPIPADAPKGTAKGGKEMPSGAEGLFP
jgi:hypothetical protein